MSTYYDSRWLLITDRLFLVRGTPQRTFPIDRINRVYAVRANTRLHKKLMVSRLWPAGFAVIVSIIIVVTEISINQSGLQTVAAAALSVCGLSVLINAVRTIPVDELWAVIDGGRHVCLWRETDRQTFGQIRRALLKARERHP